jgi:transposase InsO family protein
MLNVIDEFTRECLAIRVDRKLKSLDVIDVLSDLFILRGVPEHVRSDNGPEFIAKAVRQWIAAVVRDHHDGEVAVDVAGRANSHAGHHGAHGRLVFRRERIFAGRQSSHGGKRARRGGRQSKAPTPASEERHAELP